MSADTRDLRDADGMAPTIVLGTEEAAWARRLLNAMPFGALAHFRSTAFGSKEELTVRDVLDDVDRLREILADHAERCEREQSEPSVLRADVAAVRRVLGIPTVLHGYDAEGRPVTVRP